MRLTSANSLALCLAFLAFPLQSARALSDGPSQPEAMQFEPVDTTDLVHLPTGSFSYGVPLLIVPGPEGAYPIHINYHSGIGPNQEATWVGLGWTLNPGAINRTISGYPDDYNGNDVDTHYEADARSGYAVGIGVGYGPIGLNLNYDSYKGSLGANLLADIPMAAPGSARLSTGSDGLGASVSYGNAQVGASADGLAFSLSDPLKLLGVSLDTHGTFGYRVGNASFRTITQTSGGQYKSSSVGFDIPILPWFVNLSYSEWSWYLDETYNERSYGYLYQANYLTDPADQENKKFERQAQGRFLYASPDAYVVNAQGLSGTFRPFSRNDYRIVDHVDQRAKADLEAGSAANTREDVTFRFLGDPGGNLLTNVRYPSLGAIPPERQGSRTIEPEYDAFGKIRGFTITDVDGKIYEFRQPVMNSSHYSWSTSNPGSDEIRSSAALSAPYATNWLLTALKGPDYIDRDGDGRCSDGDDGYCVRFTYRSEGLQFWRTPYSGMAPSPSSENAFSASIGAREMVLLDRIETQTHLAVFHKSERLDRFTATPDRSLPLRGRLSQVSTTGSEYRTVVFFPGDWTPYLAQAPDGVPLIDYDLHCFYPSSDPWTNEPIFADPGGQTQSRQKADINFSFDGESTVVPLSGSCPGSLGIAYGLDARTIKLHIDQLVTEKRALARKLDRIDLYAKADPGLSRDGHGDWSVGPNATPLRSVVFDYGYDLCPETPNSRATASDGVPGGKLTLRTVRFIGRPDHRIEPGSEVPPFHFFYEGPNPRFGEDAWDRWGSYRAVPSPQELGRNKHDTSQEQYYADQAAAWSMTRVQTPTGGSISVEYESNDYFFINDYVDLDSLGFRVEVGSINPIPDLPRVWPRPGFPIPTDENDEYTPLRVDASEVEVPLASLGTERFVAGEPAAIVKAALGGYWPSMKIEVRDVAAVREESRPDGNVAIVRFAGAPIQFEQFLTSDRRLLPPDYYIKSFPRRLLGGGMRVRSLSASDGVRQYKTSYRYLTESGASSGVTASLPAFYRDFPLREQGNRRTDSNGNSFLVDYDSSTFARYRRLFLDEPTNYDRPPPGVLYSRVEAFNDDGTGSSVNGRTVYRFATAHDAPYLPNDSGGSLTVVDHSGLYGRPLSISYFEQTPSGKLRPVKEIRTEYAETLQLGAGSAVVGSDGVPVRQAGVLGRADLGSSPLGLVQEQFSFRNELTEFGEREERSVEKLYQAVFESGTSTVLSFYHDAESTGRAAEAVRSTANFLWDTRSGVAIGSAGSSSTQETVVKQRVPAWWKYPGLANRHMLNQVAQESAYRAPFDIRWRGNLPTYSFPADDLVSSSVTTWFDWGAGVVRPRDHYIYLRGLDRANGSLFSPFDWASRTVETPLPTTDRPWKLVSRITRYDRFGHEAEEAIVDGSRSAVLFDKRGEVTAVVRRGGVDESRYYDFENTEGLLTAGIADAYLTPEGQGRTGQRALRAYWRGGVSVSIPQLRARVPYRIAFWARSGTASISQAIQLYAHGPALDVGQNIVNRLQHVDRWEPIEAVVIPTQSGRMDIDIGIEGATGSAGFYHVIDDLRLHPVDGTMKTFTYDPLGSEVTSISDENQTPMTYEYDGLGRLILARDQDGRLLQKNSYRYGAISYVPSSTSLPLGLGGGAVALPVAGNSHRQQAFLAPATTLAEAAQLPRDQIKETVDYFNGLAKRWQSIAVHSAPSGADIVTPFVYDRLGAATSAYLPYPAGQNGGAFQPDAVDAQKAYYAGAPGIAPSTAPYADTNNEKSPLLRPLEKGSTGEPWQPSGRGPQAGHTKRFEYGTNIAGDVRLWQWDQTWQRWTAPGFYEVGRLDAVFTTDEGSQRTAVFSDQAGRKVLQRAIVGPEEAPTHYDTYYVYDAVGDLRVVIPPESTSGMMSSGEWWVDRARDWKWVTRLDYDDEHRVVEKGLPGAEPIFTVYDQLGRAILSQDGNLRREQRWLFRKYDALGREVLTGLYRDLRRTDRVSMQTFADRYVDHVQTFFNEVRMQGGATSFSPVFDFSPNYTNQAFPPLSPNDHVLSITYYDDFDFNFDSRTDNDYTYVPDPEFGENEPARALRNRMTGRRIRILDGATGFPSWLTTAYFYDRFGRLIESYARDLKGITIDHTGYDFAGRIVHTKRLHTSNETVLIRKRLIYDGAGRLSRVYQQTNADPEVLLAEHIYGETGQPLEKRLHSEDDGRSFLQAISYSRNIRGWLTRLNEPQNVGFAHQSIEPAGPAVGVDLFGERLSYEAPEAGVDPQFDGSISAVDWAVQPPAPPSWASLVVFDPNIHSALYAYDPQQQLRAVTYRCRTYADTCYGDRQYDEQMTYDSNGNIKTYSRGGVVQSEHDPPIYGLVDNLTYTYRGNQLVSVWDSIPGDHGYDFVSRPGPLGMGTDQYVYDAAGNLIEDHNKGITVVYNHLNLPTSVSFADGARFEWLYSASGELLRKTVTEGGIVHTTEYVGDITYRDGAIQSVETGEGRVRALTEGVYRYEYDLKDHLGNVRVVFTRGEGPTSPLLLQQSHYYAFGLQMPTLSELRQGAESKIGFGGKELNDEHGLLWLNFGKRFYDPQLGRWHTMDAAEQHHSPYVYASNRPVVAADFTGGIDVEFDERGRYLGLKYPDDDDEFHGLVINDKKEVTMRFSFNDQRDVVDLDQGKLRGIDLDIQEKVANYMLMSGAVSHNVGFPFRWIYALESLSHGKLDFVGNGTLQVVGNGTLQDRKEDLKILYTPDMGFRAYNRYDAGNFLWGFAMRALGFDYDEARLGSEGNDFFNGNRQNENKYPVIIFWKNLRWQGDDPEDQEAILRGYIAGRNYFLGLGIVPHVWGVFEGVAW